MANGIFLLLDFSFYHKKIKVGAGICVVATNIKFHIISYRLAKLLLPFHNFFSYQILQQWTRVIIGAVKVS